MQMEAKKKPEYQHLDQTIDFKTKTVTRDKEEYYIMIKGAPQQEDVTLVSIFIPNTRAPEYIKQILMEIKREIDGNTIIVRDFNTPLTSMGG